MQVSPPLVRAGDPGPQSALARKTTPRLAADGFCSLPTAFLAFCARLRGADGKPLNASEILLAIHILSFKWSEALPFPSIETLGARMGMNVRSIRKLLKRLEQAGFITRVQAPHRTNRYDLTGLFTAIEALMDEEAARVKLKREEEAEQARVRAEEHAKMTALLDKQLEEINNEIFALWAREAQQAADEAAGASEPGAQQSTAGQEGA